jgi:hypothetical protein
MIAGLALALMAVATGLYWKGRLEGAARERPKTEAALARAAVSGLETEGARASAQRVDIAVRQRDAAEAVVTQLSAKALNSEDANAPLDPDRAARLRAADDELCLAAPDLAGCPTGDDADRGGPIL